MQKALKKYFGVFLVPTLIAFATAFVIPFVIGLYLSFCEFTTLSDATFVGFDNYIKAFESGQGFIRAFGFTSVFTIASVITVNILAFALAYFLTKKIRGTNFFRTVFFMPNLIGGIVLGYTWQAMINSILVNYETTLVANPKFGFIGLIVLMNWQMIGYMMIIYIAGLQNVPPELTEASKIDGATKWQTIKNVTIPMIMPSITICIFLTLSNSFKLFDQNLALTNGAPMKQTEMVALNIVNTFYGRNNFEGVGQAKAVIFFIIVALIALSQLYFTRKKEVEH
ncbi:carbohydrate ABC transporter permease [Romboutsia sp.]|uniref:carbohydrate ABC transporter permease n=1 Tax=Romboutsia sp. TaxID=1965302 RepID=UPI003F2A5892